MSASSMQERYCGKKSAVRLLNVCSSMQATSLRCGYWLRTAETVAFSLDGEWAKSLNAMLFFVSYIFSNRLLAPVKSAMAW